MVKKRARTAMSVNPAYKSEAINFFFSLFLSRRLRWHMACVVLCKKSIGMYQNETV